MVLPRCLLVFIYAGKSLIMTYTVSLLYDIKPIQTYKLSKILYNNTEKSFFVFKVDTFLCTGQHFVNKVLNENKSIFGEDNLLNMFNVFSRSVKFTTTVLISCFYYEKKTTFNCTIGGLIIGTVLYKE